MLLYDEEIWAMDEKILVPNQSKRQRSDLTQNLEIHGYIG
jgi:hypothetical protein